MFNALLDVHHITHNSNAQKKKCQMWQITNDYYHMCLILCALLKYLYKIISKIQISCLMQYVDTSNCEVYENLCS